MSSPWVGLSRKKFGEYVNDPSRINRLRHDKSFYLVGWFDGEKAATFPRKLSTGYRVLDVETKATRAEDHSVAGRERNQ